MHEEGREAVLIAPPQLRVAPTEPPLLPIWNCGSTLTCFSTPHFMPLSDPPSLSRVENMHAWRGFPSLSLMYLGYIFVPD